MPIKLITAPTAEPITLDEAKLHCRVDHADEDALISSLIATAREAVEHITGRALMPQTLELALDDFDDVIQLPRPPFASVTSVKYLDGNGVLQTLDTASYVVDSHSEPARLMPAYGTSWPSVRDQANAVLIRYQAGYADAASVPSQIKSWMLLHIANLYANRESVVAGISVAPLPGADRLLDRQIVWGM